MMSSVDAADVDMVTQSLVQQCEHMEKVAEKKERLLDQERKEADRVIGELLTENEHINDRLVQHMKMIEEDRNVALREVKNLMEENDRMKKKTRSSLQQNLKSSTTFESVIKNCSR
eukprot:UN01098